MGSISGSIRSTRSVAPSTHSPWAASFAGQIREYRSDALKLSFVDACQARLYRTPQEVAAGEGGKYFAVFQLDGTAGMAQGDDRVLLSAGDITLIDAARPSDFTYSENSRQLSLILPYSTGRADPALQSGQVRPSDCRDVADRHALASSDSRRHPPAAPEPAGKRSDPGGDRQPAASGHQPDRRLHGSARAYLPQDPELHRPAHPLAKSCARNGWRGKSACRPAACTGCSPRRAWWWRATSRTAGWTCAPSPCANRARKQKLSVLGYSWGFSDSSYFSTAFKSRFGIAPGEYRKQHA